MAKQDNNMGDFSDLTTVKGNQVEKPKPAPEGHYSAQFSGMFKRHDAKSGNYSLRYPIKVVEPLSDVDFDQAEHGKSIEREYTIDFWMSENARWRFVEFCKAHDISDDMNIIEMAEALAAANPVFMVQAEHSILDNGDVFVNFGNPAPLSDFQG